MSAADVLPVPGQSVFRTNTSYPAFTLGGRRSPFSGALTPPFLNCFKAPSASWFPRSQSWQGAYNVTHGLHAPNSPYIISVYAVTAPAKVQAWLRGLPQRCTITERNIGTYSEVATPWTRHGVLSRSFRLVSVNNHSNYAPVTHVSYSDGYLLLISDNNVPVNGKYPPGLKARMATAEKYALHKIDTALAVTPAF